MVCARYAPAQPPLRIIRTLKRNTAVLGQLGPPPRPTRHHYSRGRGLVCCPSAAVSTKERGGRKRDDGAEVPLTNEAGGSCGGERGGAQWWRSHAARAQVKLEHYLPAATDSVLCDYVLVTLGNYASRQVDGAPSAQNVIARPFVVDHGFGKSDYACHSVRS